MMRVSLIAGCVLSFSLRVASAAEEIATPVDVQVFEGPKPISSTFDADWPQQALRRGEEGWVQLNFMVDPAGKVYEPTIVESSGNPLFEQAALQMIRKARYTPAKLGDTPVTSSQDFKVRFNLNGTGARREFVRIYRDAVDAIARGDRAAADEQLAKMAPKNLYEDAYGHLTRFTYYQKWGSEAEQLAELRRAVAYESSPSFLPRKEFVSVMSSKLILELKMRKYGSAMQSWKLLKPYAAEKDAAVWQQAITQVEAVRASDAEVRVSEQIGAGTSWHGPLFKKRFELVVTQGRLSEIKLRCEKKYLFFRYEAGVRYEVKGADGACSVEVVGDPGTKFDLVES